jgi:Kef-type K+ transport system membrane component KefB
MGAVMFIVSTKIGLMIDYILGMFIAGFVAADTISNDTPNYKMKRLGMILFWPFYVVRWFFRTVLR